MLLQNNSNTTNQEKRSIYDFQVLDAFDENVSMSEYKGKVLLIVNTATGCRYTPQYRALEELYRTYKAEGFEILDFPCNQFRNQAPGDSNQIVSFCKLTYHITFRIFKKINVNGRNTEPLFSFLKKKQGGFLTPRIKWNFTKFLVDRQGNVVKRFAPDTTPDQMRAHIEALLRN